MSRKLIVYLTFIGTLLLVVAGAQALASSGVDNTQVTLGTSFTYQGQLKNNGQPVTADCSLAFRLYDAATGGAQVGSPITRAIPVTDGLFTVALDFGASAFTGDARWLGIQVQCIGDAAYIDLGRQTLTAAPYALYALGAPWSGLRDVPPGFADGVDDVSVIVSGTQVYAGEGLTQLANDNAVTLSLGMSYRLPQMCANGQIAEWNGALWVCGNDDVGSGGASWSLTGNVGTNPLANFLGTTDAVSLTLAVNGASALRLEPHATSPNVVGGYGGNVAWAGVYGASIGGGGASGAINGVYGNYGAVGGGVGNAAYGELSTIAGGDHNAAGYEAMVGGGDYNHAQGDYSVVAGGDANHAAGNHTFIGGGITNYAGGPWAVIGGGESNWITATHGTIAGGYNITVTGDYAVVGGGANNTASGYASVIGGGGGFLTSGDPITNTASGDWSVIGGGVYNTASSMYATIDGGFSNTASGMHATIGGGVGNTASSGDVTIGGGIGNRASNGETTIGGGLVNTASGWSATVSGGALNMSSGNYAAIGGGSTNTSSGGYATVGGGYHNRAIGLEATIGGGTEISVTGRGATVAGGSGITVTGDYAAAGGGLHNLATDDYAVVGGGESNLVNATYGTIAGGYQITVTGGYAAAGGGGYNSVGGAAATIGGGWINTTGDTWATIGGGMQNTANGASATIPGGSQNTAGGDNSFAAGHLAWVGPDAHGSFVWSDNHDFYTRSWNPNEFVARATGGFWFFTGIDGSGNVTGGARLPANEGTWYDLSDRNAKANFAAIDGRDVLARLATIPIQTWNYKAQTPAVRHIGPMAQDFYAAFGMGGDEHYISTVDADGVALAAIQGLYQTVQEQDARLAAQQTELDALRQQNADLETRLAALEAQTTGSASSAAPIPWALAAGGLFAFGMVVTQRRHGGGTR